MQETRPKGQVVIQCEAVASNCKFSEFPRFAFDPVATARVLTRSLTRFAVHNVSSHRMINWSEIRQRFPVTERFAYLNSAAAGPVSTASQAAAAGYYEKMMRDGDVHWNRWLADREAVRQKIAELINAEPDEI